MMNSPEHETELTPEEAVRRMAVDHLPGVYMLSAGFEKRMSTIAQQIRAVSLVGTLFEHNKVVRGSKVAVVGAGAAGVTAATLAAWRGAEVHVFEKNPIALSTYADSNRLIHPRLYEWPDKDWSKEDAALPLLNWSANTGREVTRNLREQWDWWLDLFGCPNSKEQRLFWYPKTPLLDEPCGPDANDEYALRTRGGRMSGFQVVIIAVGFGPLQLLESIKSDEPWIYDYWADKPAIPENATIAVSGRNDSGLTEAIELAAVLCIEGKMQLLDQATLPLLLQMSDFVSLRPELELMEATLQKGYRQIPQNAPDRLERISQIESQAYKMLRKIGQPIIDRLVNDATIQCADSRRVLLLRRSDPDLTSDAFVLNRFVAAHLIRLGWITVIPHIDARQYAREADGTFRVPGIESPIDILLIRHGPGPVLETRIVEESWRQQLATQGLTGPGIRFGIARRRPPQPYSANDRILLSDLYDSTTQARVFEALLEEHESEAAAENELVELYQSRLFLEFVRRDRVIVVDTQFFDGAFFLRWIPRLSRDEREFVGKRLVIRRRCNDPAEVLRRFCISCSSFKPFEFSAIVVESHRDELESALAKAKDQGIPVPENLNDLAKHLELSPDACQSWAHLRSLHNKLLSCLDGLCFEQFELGSPDWPFDHYSHIEDPARFAIERSDYGKWLLTQMFRKSVPFRSDM